MGIVAWLIFHHALSFGGISIEIPQEYDPNLGGSPPFRIQMFQGDPPNYDNVYACVTWKSSQFNGRSYCVPNYGEKCTVSSDDISFQYALNGGEITDAFFEANRELSELRDMPSLVLKDANLEYLALEKSTVLINMLAGYSDLQAGIESETWIAQQASQLCTNAQIYYPKLSCPFSISTFFDLEGLIETLYRDNVTLLAEFFLLAGVRYEQLEGATPAVNSAAEKRLLGYADKLNIHYANIRSANLARDRRDRLVKALADPNYVTRLIFNFSADFDDPYMAKVSSYIDSTGLQRLYGLLYKKSKPCLGDSKVLDFLRINSN